MVKNMFLVEYLVILDFNCAIMCHLEKSNTEYKLCLKLMD